MTIGPPSGGPIFCAIFEPRVTRQHLTSRQIGREHEDLKHEEPESAHAATWYTTCIVM